MKFIIKKKFLLTSIFLLSINQIIYIPKVNSETCHGYAVRNADKSYLVIDPEDYWRLKRDCEAGFPKPFKLKMPSFDFFNQEKRRVRKYEKQKYRESVDRLSPRQKQIRQQELLEYKELVDKRRAERLERLERRRL